jgi:hypothetical protein
MRCAPFSSAELKQVVLNLLALLVLEYNKKNADAASARRAKAGRTQFTGFTDTKKNADAAVRAELQRGALLRPYFCCIYFFGP